MSWRCLRCWGRMRRDVARDAFVCRDCGHRVSAIMYAMWRSDCPRPTGHVIGPATGVHVIGGGARRRSLRS